MSVLIKDVEMPKYCGSCFVGDRTICRDGCPLVEVPTPHGDLIDSEEFKNILTLGAVTAQMLGSDENTCSDIQFMKEILG